jgi:Protein of unknown function (DUF962)
MISPPLGPEPWVDHWYERHTNAACFVLHLVGIPPTLLGALLIPIYLFRLSIPIFLFALVSFVGGYLTQFLGHVFERTDPGEIIYFKRKLGLSYVEFATGPGGLRRDRPSEAGVYSLHGGREEPSYGRPVDEAGRPGPHTDRTTHHLAVSDLSP